MNKKDGFLLGAGTIGALMAGNVLAQTNPLEQAANARNNAHNGDKEVVVNVADYASPLSGLNILWDSAGRGPMTAPPSISQGATDLDFSELIALPKGSSASYQIVPVSHIINLWKNDIAQEKNLVTRNNARTNLDELVHGYFSGLNQVNDASAIAKADSFATGGIWTSEEQNQLPVGAYGIVIRNLSGDNASVYAVLNMQENDALEPEKIYLPGEKVITTKTDTLSTYANRFIAGFRVGTDDLASGVIGLEGEKLTVEGEFAYAMKNEAPTIISERTGPDTYRGKISTPDRKMAAMANLGLKLGSGWRVFAGGGASFQKITDQYATWKDGDEERNSNVVDEVHINGLVQAGLGYAVNDGLEAVTGVRHEQDQGMSVFGGINAKFGPSPRENHRTQYQSQHRTHHRTHHRN